MSAIETKKRGSGTAAVIALLLPLATKWFGDALKRGTGPTARSFPLAMIVLVLPIVFLLPLVRSRESSGRWLFSRLRHASELLLVALSLVMIAESIVWAFAPELLKATTLFTPHPFWGFGVLFLGALLITQSQVQMGDSWRIGIDDAARPGLTTKGPFRFSRNPGAVGTLGIAFGLTLAMPTLLSGAVLLLAAMALKQQATHEELYLARAYGAEYRQYAQRVGRFLPGIGREHAT